MWWWCTPNDVHDSYSEHSMMKMHATENACYCMMMLSYVKWWFHVNTRCMLWCNDACKHDDMKDDEQVDRDEQVVCGI